MDSNETARDVNQLASLGIHCDLRARFNAAWQLPEVRYCHRLITTVRGSAFAGELIVRIILIYNTSPAMVLVISPILLGTLTTIKMVWAFSYGHRVRLRAMAEINQVLRPRVA